MALPEKTWLEIRVEYETTDISVNKLAKKHGISHTAIQKKIDKEGWERFQNVDKVATSGVFGTVGKNIGNKENSDSEFQEKVAIILEHRKQAAILRQLIESAIEYDENGNILKTNSRRTVDAKRISDAMKNAHSIDRAAWGIDDHFGTLTELQIQNRNRLLQKCLDNEIDNVAQAGILFDLAGIPMPKSIEIILKKTPIDKPEPVVDDVFSEEELDAEYEARMKEIEQQKKEWLPGRVKDIEELKHEMKDGDSFSPGFEIEKGEKDTQPNYQ